MDYEEDGDTDQACRAHGISLRLHVESDASSDSGRSDFDDVYELHNPDPLPLSELEHRIVLVQPKIGHEQQHASDEEPRIEDTLEHVPNARVANQFAVLNLDNNDDEDTEEEEDGDGEEEDGVVFSSDVGSGDEET